LILVNDFRGATNHFGFSDSPPTFLCRRSISSTPTFLWILIYLVIVLHLSGENDENRVIVFCSEESLKVLYESTEIFADGTFKTVSNQFGQLYTVHGVLKDTSGKKNVFPRCLRYV